MDERIRSCADCGVDISARHRNAQRCQRCAARAERQRLQARKRRYRARHTAGLGPVVHMPRKCTECDVEFVPLRHNQLVCSSTCRQAREANAQRARATQRRRPRTCPACRTIFTPSRSDVIACSARCYRRTRQRPATQHTKTCEYCDNAFTSKRSDARYCPSRCGKRAHYEAVGRRAAIARAAAWAEANALQRAVIAARYKARRKGWTETGPGVSVADWLATLRRHGHRCTYCGAAEPLQMDHVVPLSRGGRHSIGNVLPSCGPCNLSKNAKLLVEWNRDGRRRWQVDSSPILQLLPA